MIYIHFSAIHNYVFVKYIYIYIYIHNVAHQKENSFGSKEKSSKLNVQQFNFY